MIRASWFVFFGAFEFRVSSPLCICIFDDDLDLSADGGDMTLRAVSGSMFSEVSFGSSAFSF